tara:strand:- start:73718 stop:74488 length:771 start_codon:yes stop_codon:yes gene_type:complete
MHSKSTTLIQTAAIAVITGVTLAQPLVSNFDSSIEGWTVETHGNPSGAFALMNTYAPDFNSFGGAPGGYISEVDPDNQWSFFRAPPAWSGDRSQYAGGWLHYATRTDSDTFPDGRLVILIGNDGQEISADLGIPDLNVWTNRHIRLLEGSWRLGTNASGAVATQTEIDAILADLEALFIGLEFGSDLLEELVGLDSVSLSECLADLNGDGALNFLDISTFLAGFAAQDPAMDFVQDNSFNFLDVSAFLQLFGAGCP